jgi:hypothetical protein
MQHPALALGEKLSSQPGAGQAAAGMPAHSAARLSETFQPEISLPYQPGLRYSQAMQRRANRMTRRQLIEDFVARPAAALLAVRAHAGVRIGVIHYLKSLGHARGPRYLDGKTHDGTVSLVRGLVKPFSGTKWQIVSLGGGIVGLRCRGDENGPRWLDGRTHDGSIGLAPHTKAPFTGTRWQIIEADGGFVLKCLGAIEGPRWLDGRTHNGSVGLAKVTTPPFTGTKWEIGVYPVCTDEPCALP